MRPSLTAPVARRRAGSKHSLAAFAMLRGTTYGLLGSLFVYPAGPDLAALATEGAALIRGNPLVRDLPFLPALRSLVDLLDGLGDEQLEQLEQEYLDIFLVGASQQPCPPYESAYLEQGRERGLIAVAVERAYAAAGVTLSERGEPPDHAAIELAFLSVLCSEEEEKWRRGEAEEALELLRRQQEFQGQHLGRWFPAFCGRLADATAPGSLYRALARTAHAFVAHDRDLVRALVDDRSLAIARLGGTPS